ncbi:MAG TPA: glycosyltransferase [Chitinophagaceae bacterium]|nr:glycosyltransferase [Chitinophagaceae bacterium]
MPDTTTIQPLVSVALCTYNGAKFIQAQLDSILQQTWNNLEIIISDDGSVDETKAIIDEYSQQDNRIRFFQNQSNLGYNKNFEMAFSHCTGELIAISDQDDIWEKDKIEIMMKNWPAGSLFVYSLSGNFMDNDFDGRTEAPNVRYTNIDNILKLVFNSPVHGHACMFKKELLNRCLPFPENIFYDWWMSMHAAATGVVGCIPQTLTWHRTHSANFSRTLMNIEDREKKDKQLKEQMIHFIETFYQSTTAAAEQRKLLKQYAGILKEMNGRKFSSRMFGYVLRNRKLIFHYKKRKALLFLSEIKHAWRMARRGLL